MFVAGAKKLQDMGYVLHATEGTHEFLDEFGVPSKKVEKLHDGKHPNYRDLLREGRIGFSLVIPERFTDNTKREVVQGLSDGYLMRRMSIDLGIPIFTNAQTARLFVESIASYTIEDLEIRSWNEYK